MQFSALIMVVTFLGLSANVMAAPSLSDTSDLVSRDNGARNCLGGGISCEYPKGRCAVLCLNTNCGCPDGQADNPYTRATCITALQAAGRQSC